MESLFLRRWSPRAMSGEALETGELMRLLEAARWAPSTYNVQEWRFLYAYRHTDHWPLYFELLVEANQRWCCDAGALVLVTSKTTFDKDGSENPVHAFDARLATQNLLLQAASLGLIAHPMTGFNRYAARIRLGLPDDVEPAAMVALGRPGDPSTLPGDMTHGERQPSGRKPVREIACEGVFNF